MLIIPFSLPVFASNFTKELVWGEELQKERKRWSHEFYQTAEFYRLKANYETYPVGHKPKKIFDLSFVSHFHSEWGESDFLTEAVELNQVFNQCGVGLNSVTVIVASIPEEQLKIEKSLILDSIESVPGVMSDQVQLAKTTPRDHVVTFFMKADVRHRNKYERVAWAYGEKSTKRLQQHQMFSGIDVMSVSQTVWMFSSVKERGYTHRYMSGYSTLAHELFHVIANDHSHFSGETGNLMHNTRRKIDHSLTEEQCEQLKSSSLVRDYSTLFVDSEKNEAPPVIEIPKKKKKRCRWSFFRRRKCQ